MDELRVIGDDNTKQYIVVSLGIEHFGIDIGYIDNIVRMQKITRVPKAQHYFKGIINLRGEIVPVMSIRRKMGLDDDVITNKTRIIILRIEDSGCLGVLVDEVREVVTLSGDQIDRFLPDSREGGHTFLNGIGKNGENLISLLDIGKIVDERDAV